MQHKHLNDGHLDDDLNEVSGDYHQGIWEKLKASVLPGTIPLSRLGKYNPSVLSFPNLTEQNEIGETILHCKAKLGGGQPGLMRWIVLWIMPLVQDQSLDLLTLSPAHYHWATDGPNFTEQFWAELDN